MSFDLFACADRLLERTFLPGSFLLVTLIAGGYFMTCYYGTNLARLTVDGQGYLSGLSTTFWP